MDEQAITRAHAAVVDAWLGYARAVLTDEAHWESCRATGGSPADPERGTDHPHPGVDAIDLRWPGYLGARAVPGELVLVVGNVHRNFASGQITADDRDRLVATTRDWRDGRASDDDYLAATRSVYSKGLSGGWVVSRHLVPTLRELDLGISSIAYINAARCQYPEIPPVLPAASATKLALQRLCLRRFPLTDLAAILRPRVVLYSSVTAFDAAQETGVEVGVPQVCFHQLYGNLARPVRLNGRTLPAKTTTRGEWASALRAHLDGPVA